MAKVDLRAMVEARRLQENPELGEFRVQAAIDQLGFVRNDAARQLKEAGAADVIIVATHGILSGPAIDRLKNAPINEVVLTNTLPIPPERQIDGMTVLSIAPLIGRAIREVFEDGSVTSLFDGAS